ncbi:MAG: alginate lyase family protein [Rikenellaceae bacterium]
MKKLLSLALLFVVSAIFSYTSNWSVCGAATKSTTKDFSHPTVVYSPDQIAKLKAIIKKGDRKSVAYKSYKDLVSYPRASASWKDYVGKIPFYIARDSGEKGQLDRSGNPYPFSFSKNATMVTQHLDAAYMSALLFALDVDNAKAHGAKSLAILSGYAKNVRMVCNTGNAPLMCGQAYHIAAAVALLKEYGCEGLTDEIYDSIVNDLLIGCFVPVLDFFFNAPPYTNGNWGMCAILSYMAIAIVADNQEMYDFAINQYINGKDNGTIYNYIDEKSGQCQETGRDQAHVQFGFSCAALICEIAYNQGDEYLYMENETALLTGLEYTAKLLLGEEVPYYVWTDITGKYCRWKSIGTADPESGPSYNKCWSVAYNHYVNRLGKSMPNSLRLLEKNGWPSKYSSEGYWFDMFTFAPHPNDNK